MIHARTAIRGALIVLGTIVALLLIYDAGSDALRYYREYTDWQRAASTSNPMANLKPGQRLRPNLQPIHRVDTNSFPTYISGLSTVQVAYKIDTDGFGAKPNEYVHVDILATPSDFDVVPLATEDIPTNKGGTSLFYVTPKRDGFLNVAIRAQTYLVNPRTLKHTNVGFEGMSSLVVLVDEPILSVPWFEAHPFAKDLFFALFPLAIGFVAGRLSSVTKED